MPSGIKYRCLSNSVLAQICAVRIMTSVGVKSLYPFQKCDAVWAGDQGWGLLSQFPPFRYFPNFSSLSKHTLTVKYRIYIWQVSPQLSCGDTCQIWMWFDESNMYFCEIENFAYGEINERSFSNPHPRLAVSVPGTDNFIDWIAW